MRYRRLLLSLSKQLRQSVNNNIVPLLRQFEQEYVNDAYVKDAYASILKQAFESLRAAYSGIGIEANFVSSQFVSGVDQVNKKQFYSAMNRAIGVNVQSVIQSEDLADVLIAETAINVELITSIGQEYLKNVESIVYTGTTQGNTPQSMIKQLRNAGAKSDNKAKLIARDQTAKLNSALNQQRQQNLGVEEYVWRTAEDDRVRPTHKAHDGKTFKWSDPPKDTGHPGNDIQCRCIAQPLIKI